MIILLSVLNKIMKISTILLIIFQESLWHREAVVLLD